MHIYYFHYVSDAPDLGVSKKINAQLIAFQKAGFKTSEIAIKRDLHDSLFTKAIRHLLPGSIDENLKSIKESVFYIRGNLADAYYYNLYKTLRANNNIIIVEVPTFPFKDECKGLQRLQYYLHLCWIGLVKKYINFYVGISTNQNIYGVETISIDNGIAVSKYALKKKLELRNTINVIMVAHFHSFHGVDRFIQGLRDYYKNEIDKKVILHLVGDGDVLNNLHKMIDTYQLEDKCIFYGRKTGVELDSIYDNMHIGLASIGLHRINLFKASVLKSREYSARGLPFVTSVEISDMPKNFKYVKYLPADESPIDISDVVKFAEKVYSEVDFQLKLRKWAEENLSWEIKMDPVVRKIKSLTGISFL